MLFKSFAKIFGIHIMYRKILTPSQDLSQYNKNNIRNINFYKSLHDIEKQNYNCHRLY